MQRTADQALEIAEPVAFGIATDGCACAKVDMDTRGGLVIAEEIEAITAIQRIGTSPPIDTVVAAAGIFAVLKISLGS